MNPPHVDGRRGWKVALLAVVSVGTFVVSTGPAASAPAQDPSDCVPSEVYSCPEDESDVLGVAQDAPTCTASPSTGAPGTRVEVLVTDVPAGQAVELRLNGRTVAAEAADAAGDQPTADVPMSFVVPAETPGNYTLVAVGAGFQADCLSGGGFGVLARTTPGQGSGPLARTGTNVITLLAIAVALIVVGRVVQQRGDRRHRGVRR